MDTATCTCGKEVTIAEMLANWYWVSGPNSYKWYCSASCAGRAMAAIEDAARWRPTSEEEARMAE